MTWYAISTDVEAVLNFAHCRESLLDRTGTEFMSTISDLVFSFDMNNSAPHSPYQYSSDF